MIDVAMTESDRLRHLLLQMAQKNEAAFEQLYLATKRKLFSIIVAIVKCQHVAEELLQEAYVRIWLNAAAYRPASGSPMTWMISIARNRAIDLARRPVREISSDDAFFSSIPASCPTPLEQIEISEDRNRPLMHRAHILHALGSLDSKRRELVIAAYIHGESRKQLSMRFGVPVSTIKTWIRRALLETRASLEDPDNIAGREGFRTFRRFKPASLRPHRQDRLAIALEES